MQKLQFKIDSGFIRRLKWNRFSLNTSFSYQLFGVYCERPWISDTWKIPKIPIFPLFSITVSLINKSRWTCWLYQKQLRKRYLYAVSWHKIEIQQVVEGLRRQNDGKSLDCFLRVIRYFRHQYDLRIFECLFTFKKINLLIFSNSIQLLYLYLIWTQPFQLLQLSVAVTLSLSKLLKVRMFFCILFIDVQGRRRWRWMNSIKIQFDYDRIRNIEGKNAKIVHSGTFSRFQSVSDLI